MSSNQSYWIRSAIFTLFERGSVLLFGLGSTIILLRSLSKEDFGEWVTFMTITAFIEVGRSGLQRNGLVKYLSTCNEEDYGKVSTASLSLNIIITLFCLAFLFFAADPLSNLLNAPNLRYLLPIYMITTTLLIPFFQINFTQQANLDFKGIFWSNFTKQGLFFSYIVTFFLFDKELILTEIALWQIVTAIAGAFVSWFFGRKYLRFEKKIDWKWVSKLFHYGKFVLGTNLSTMLYKSIDTWMLGGLINQRAVGIYGTAIRVTNLADVPTQSMAAIVFPQSARQNIEDKDNALKLLYEKSVGAILAFLLPATLIILIFPYQIINLIAGSQYLEAVPVLQLTMLYGLFLPFAVQFGTLLDSIGKPKINFYFTLGGALLNVLFNYLFISKFGLIGAAYGTLTTYCITFIMMQSILNRMFGVNFTKAFVYAYQFYGQGYDLIRNYKTKRNKQKTTPPISAEEQLTEQP